MPAPGTDQETVYTYGTTKGAGTSDSRISTGHLLSKVAYPDSSGPSDVVTSAYDAQSRRIYVQDQAGNETTETYDAAGRQTARSVVTLASGFDGDVRRIETAYDSRGRRSTVTQYDAATAGSVVDQVKYSYDGWGNVLEFEQDRNSEVGASGSVDDYEVTYSYEKATGGRNTVRRIGMNLPSGNLIRFGYSSTSGQLDGDASRVTEVKDGGVILARYRYNGAGQLVNTRYPEIGLRYRHHGSTSGVYDRLDRFNRVTNVSWSKSNGASVYDVDLEWDRGGNILSIDDHIHDGFDVGVVVDDLDRVTRAQEGTLSGGSITSTTRDQQWTLDQLGNWDENLVDLNGDGDYVDTDELDEVRSHNDVNEITGRDIDDDGTDEYKLSHDAVGQLTDDGEDYEYEWDAFGRLRRIVNRSTSALVEEMTYNGLGYLIAEHYDTDGDGDVDGSDNVRWHAYDDQWRTVATYRAGDSDPKEEWVNHQSGFGGVWSSSMINAVVARYRDRNAGEEAISDGILEERVYYCQNWRGDVGALMGSAGYQVEQVRYSAYGVPFGLPGGDLDSDGDCDSTDRDAVISMISTSSYDSRADLDMSGAVDASDKAVLSAVYVGAVSGYEFLSLAGSTRGSQGAIELRSRTGGAGLDRRRGRVYATGSWWSRDPVGYRDSASLYSALAANPYRYSDVYGLSIHFPDGSIGAIPMPPRKGEDPVDLEPYFPPPPINPWCPGGNLEECYWNCVRKAAEECSPTYRNIAMLIAQAYSLHAGSSFGFKAGGLKAPKCHNKGWTNNDWPGNAEQSPGGGIYLELDTVITLDGVSDPESCGMSDGEVGDLDAALLGHEMGHAMDIAQDLLALADGSMGIGEFVAKHERKEEYGGDAYPPLRFMTILMVWVLMLRIK